MILELSQVERYDGTHVTGYMLYIQALALSYYEPPFQQEFTSAPASTAVLRPEFRGAGRAWTNTQSTRTAGNGL